MRGPQPTATMAVVVVVVGMLVTSTFSTPLSGTKEVKEKPTLSWPETGLELCQMLVEDSLQESCEECFNRADNLGKIKKCVKENLPSSFARCSNTSNNKKKFNDCVFEGHLNNEKLNKRANVFYAKSNIVLKKIANFKQLANGPSALFSSFSQRVLFNKNNIKEALSTSEDCIERYSRDQRREVEPTLLTDHLQPRVTDYEYGKVGHDMPFKGVGSLALAALSGTCNIRYLEDQQKVQLVVDTAVNLDLPVPAWVFQEIVKTLTAQTY